MQSPVNVITDKIMGTLEGMVYMAMRVSYRRGATVSEISSFLGHWAPSTHELSDESLIERVLEDLSRDGKVNQAGARWYPAGLAH